MLFFRSFFQNLHILLWLIIIPTTDSLVYLGPSNTFKIVKMIMERKFQPVIVFSFSKKECEAYALQMSKLDFNTGGLLTCVLTILFLCLWHKCAWLSEQYVL